MRSLLFVVVYLHLFFAGSLAIRSQWIQQGRAPASALIPIRFALSQSNLDVLEKTLLDVSNPLSANYGKWKTAAEVTEMVAPCHTVTDAVVSFLRAKGAEKVENRRDMVKVTASVRWIEETLQTSLFLFQHTKRTSKVIIRAVGGYTIPFEIEAHVDFVAGLFEFPSIRDVKTDVVSSVASVNGYVVPYVVQNLYDIPTTFPVNAKSSICLVEFQDDQSYSKSDLKLFSQQNDIKDIVVSKIVGPYSDSNPDAESTLDVEYGAAIALNTTVWFWTIEDWMYDFATDLLNTTNPPLVASMSWGWPEPEQCQVGNCTDDETSYEYVQRTNVEFQKIGLMGITLVAASGDQGAPGDSDPDCTGRLQPLSTIFPGASPWVLSVGATMLTNNTDVDAFAAVPPICKTHDCSNSTMEEVCSYPEALITSGGGFSNYVPTPSYQQAAVSAYLSSGVTLPPARDFNKTNRGFPDLAALGHNYLIGISGDFEQVDGTSASSPVVAAMIALLNSYRLNNGKAPLGFVVPLIYQAFAADPTIFKDITTGDNKCTENCCDKYGYEATKGWDPVTGVGTPNFAKLLAYVKTLP